MTALLAKSYCRERYPDAPPDYALLTQHSRDVAEACDTLAREIGRLTLLNAGLSEDAFESFRLQLRANGWIQDLGKVSSHFQQMVSGSPQIKQLLRHETISGLLMFSDSLPFRKWLGERFADEVLLTCLWSAMGHHRKFDKLTKPELTLALTATVSHSDFKTILREMGEDLRLSSPPTLDHDLIIAQTHRDQCDIGAREALRDLQDDFLDAEELFIADSARRRLALIKGLGIGADVAASAIAFRGQSASKYSVRDFVAESLSVGLTSQDLQQIITQWAWNRSAIERSKENEGEMPADVRPRPFQAEVANAKSHLTFAEAGCGSGKSLAAYMWANEWCRRIGTCGRNNFRLFFCLPTTGTTTEHFKDYALESGIDPKLMSLTHSRASIDLRAIAETAPQEESIDQQDGPASAAQDALNAEKDKIQSLALWSTPLVVTTTDTVLGLMVNARRSIYSLPALMCGAFVFDEIHAFDDQLFGHLLVFLKNFPNLPVLLMTASLPKQRLDALKRTMSKQRNKLLYGKAAVANDRAQRAAIEFLVIGNGGLRGRGFANQNYVAAALSIDFKANFAERLDAQRAGDDRQLTQAATSTNSTRSSGNGSPRSRSTSSCNEIASRTLARASSRFFPWLMQPGRLGTSATTKPSSPGYNRTRRVIGLPQHAGFHRRTRLCSPARLSSDQPLTATTWRQVTFDSHLAIGLRVHPVQVGFPGAVVARRDAYRLANSGVLRFFLA